MPYARMNLEINSSLRVEPEDGLYVSTCEALDLANQGNTEEEALASIVEAITLFLGECAETGMLLQVLQEGGFTALRDKQPPRKRTLAVPHAIPLLITNARPQTV